VNFRLQDQTEVSPSDAFFITGSGRCGTTLLRRLIVEKSGAVIPPENYSLGVSGRFSSAAQQDWGLSCRLIIGEVQRDSPQNGAFGVDAAMAISLLSSIPPEHRTIANFWHAFHAIYATHVGKPSVSRWGDKTPLNAARLDNIIELFPTARFIFMIRDIFDVAYSYGSMDVVGRRGNYLDGARRWVESNWKIRDFSQRYPEHSLFVRYEDLVNNNGSCLDAVFSFLSLQSSNVPPMSKNETTDMLAIPHLRNSLGEVRSDFIGKGAAELPQEMKQEMARLASDLRGFFGYF
jgi:protein-tyrosine sulfotransferase